MNKGDLVNEVAKVVCTKKEAQTAVECVFDFVTKTLKKKGQVAIAGFGTFKVAKRKARTGRNPQTGAELKIAAKSVPKFTAGKALKDAVDLIRLRIAHVKPLPGNMSPDKGFFCPNGCQCLEVFSFELLLHLLPKRPYGW